MAETYRESEGSLKKDLHLFIAAISPMGKAFGLNPHIEDVRLKNAVANYSRPVALISEDGFKGKLKRIIGAGHVARILEVPPFLKHRQVDYLFVHKYPLKREVYLKLHKFVQRTERWTGVRIYLTPENDLTQWENE